MAGSLDPIPPSPSNNYPMQLNADESAHDGVQSSTANSEHPHKTDTNFANGTLVSSPVATTEQYRGADSLKTEHVPDKLSRAPGFTVSDQPSSKNDGPSSLTRGANRKDSNSTQTVSNSSGDSCRKQQQRLSSNIKWFKSDSAMHFAQYWTGESNIPP